MSSGGVDKGNRCTGNVAMPVLGSGRESFEASTAFWSEGIDLISLKLYHTGRDCVFSWSHTPRARVFQVRGVHLFKLESDRGYFI